MVRTLLFAIITVLTPVVLLGGACQGIQYYEYNLSRAARQARFVGDVELSGRTPFRDLKLVLKEPKGVVDPIATTTENEGVASLVEGLVKLRFYWPSCREAAPSLDTVTCNEVRPIRVRIDYPFRGSVFGVRITHSKSEVSAALQQRFRKVREDPEQFYQWTVSLPRDDEADKREWSVDVLRGTFVYASDNGYGMSYKDPNPWQWLMR